MALPPAAPRVRGELPSIGDVCPCSTLLFTGLSLAFHCPCSSSLMSGSSMVESGDDGRPDCGVAIVVHQVVGTINMEGVESQNSKSALGLGHPK